MKSLYSRRKFIRTSAIAGAGLSLVGSNLPLLSKGTPVNGKRVGIIGLDTSHCIAFTQMLNVDDTVGKFGGYKVIAAYPKGSLDIESSVSRIPEYTEKVKSMGVEIVDSIEELLKKVDVVLLETNDGRRHLEQAIPVLKAGKTMFIDKPLSASLKDGIAIFELAKHYKVPVFSSSSLRFMSSAQEVANGKIGKVLGADTYSPCSIEETHPDIFWYGIHGVEILYTVMGAGCREVIRIHSESTDMAVGTWADGRIGAFRGTRTGVHSYGGTAYGEKGDAVLGPLLGYEPLLAEIVKFFDSGLPPVHQEETLEMLTFMEAADESKRKMGASVKLEEIWKKANSEAQRTLKKLI
ncbi:MAG: Gfo/Idh/MocA family oxidoreductase [Bacteroidetes bacterium]|nr:Gfo/Idh/MocA family oxidoreductase [Bacteroidota bacterium]